MNKLTQKFFLYPEHCHKIGANGRVRFNLYDVAERHSGYRRVGEEGNGAKLKIRLNY